MKLTSAHSELFGSLADDIERNESSWKEVQIQHTRTCSTCHYTMDRYVHFSTPHYCNTIKLPSYMLYKRFSDCLLCIIFILYPPPLLVV